MVSFPLDSAGVAADEGRDVYRDHQVRDGAAGPRLVGASQDEAVACGQAEVGCIEGAPGD